MVKYNATSANGIEYLRLNFKPKKVKVNGKEILNDNSLNIDTYKIKDLGNGDYSIVIKRNVAGEVDIMK